MKCPNCQAEISETAQFCGHCGVQTAAALPGVGTATMPTSMAVKRRRWPVVLLVIVLIVMAGVAAVIFLDLPIPVSGSDRILYAVQDNGVNSLVNTIAAINPDGRDPQEIFYDRDGFLLSTTPYSNKQFLAPNGRWLALYESTDDGWELVLIPADGGAPLLIDDRALRSSGIRTQGFSPDSKRFAYTTFDEDNEEITLYVVDETGNELVSVPDAVFGDFFPDGKRLLVIETDEEGLFTALAWLDVETGELARIADLSDSSGWVRPLVSADGERVYFYADDELVVMGLDGGAAERVYEFDGWRSVVFFAPDNQTLAIYDQPDGEYLGELRLVHLATDRSTRIDRDVNLSAASNHAGSQSVGFSGDGKLIAYLTGQPGDLSLYVVGRDGSDRRRLSDNNLWLAFAFSPNGKQIAYVEGDAGNEPGTLYIANVDGSDRLRLDIDVWSFQFARNGRYLVYSKVNDLDRGDPESEIFRIRPDGKGQELLMGPQNGLVSLLVRTQ